MIEYTASELATLMPLVDEYTATLAYPMDSYVEDNFLAGQFVAIQSGGEQIGFHTINRDTLWGIYLRTPWLRYAQVILDGVIGNNGVKEIYYQTSDPLMVALVSDWEYEKKKSARFFEDAVRLPRPQIDLPDLTFDVATADDMSRIQEETSNFFTPDDLKAGTVYMLQSEGNLLGCGISVPGKLFRDCVSIGMVTCKAYRKRGIGKYILWSLKEKCYEQGLKPIAGCWYYNTLSGKTLESVGMVSRARGVRAILTGKETIPEWTGNPPGEPVVTASARC